MAVLEAILTMDALTFSWKLGTDVPDNTVYTFLPTLYDIDCFDLCNVGIMVVFIFLADVETARWQIQIYLFITINDCYFVLMVKIRQARCNIPSDIQRAENVAWFYLCVVWSRNICVCTG